VSSIEELASKYQRVYSVVSDDYGIDPLLDTLVPEILKITNYSTHEINQHERGAPDLISLNEYGTDQLWWFIMVYNGIGSHRDITEGKNLKIPDYTSLVSVVTHNSIRPTNVVRVVTI
jgi:hypothetical protein